VHKVVIACAIDNPHIHAVAERLGFLQEGLLLCWLLGSSVQKKG
jgi:RimJ/RimL family protein N-acetyltransferase